VRIAVVAFLAVLALTTSVHAAFPRLIMFSGGSLRSPLVMTDWPALAAFLQGLPEPLSIPEEALSGRPFLQVTMFWGPQWKAYMDEGKSVSALRPEQGNEHGRFYPATANASAVLLLTGAPNYFDTPRPVPVELQAFSKGHVLDANSLRLLERAGVPVSTVAR
jgi:hypothetical protein